MHNPIAVTAYVTALSRKSVRLLTHGKGIGILSGAVTT